MFERWRQENFFKHLPREHALDALEDYAAVPDIPERDVPSPRQIALTKDFQHARATMPERIPVRIVGIADVVKLTPERTLLTNFT